MRYSARVGPGSGTTPISEFTVVFIEVLHGSHIRPCHKAAILPRGTKKALFYHAKPHPHGFHCEAKRGKTKFFWSPGTIWPPCDKGESDGRTMKIICIRKNICSHGKKNLLFLPSNMAAVQNLYFKASLRAKPLL